MLRPFLLVLLSSLETTFGISCYECSSAAGRDCLYSPKACGYGFFGCVKMAVYNGGIDKMGNRYNEEAHIVSMLRGCSVLPLNTVEMCEQSSILGYRIVTCTCYNDFCNFISSNVSLLSVLLILLYHLFMH